LQMPVKAPRAARTRARHPGWAAGSLLVATLGCGVLGPPGGDPQYPALQIPTRLEPAKPAAKSPPAPAVPSAGSSAEATGTGHTRLVRDPATADAGTATPVPPEHGYPPDPPPLTERAWWVYPVTYDRGTLRVDPPTLECLARPAASARRMGRFAFELWVGGELVDRLRFDFPLLAAEVPRSAEHSPMRQEPSFAPGARVSVTVRVPASARAVRAHILDRASGQTTPVDWPPHAPSPSAELCPNAPPPKPAPK
jgi:hypothetical protein